MAIGCSAKCAKVILIVLNILFWLTGVILIVAGALTTTNTHVQLLAKIMPDGSAPVSSAGIVAIVLGVIVFLIGFFGCCGAIRESKCLLGIYIGCLVVIIIIEIAAGIFIGLKKKEIIADMEGQWRMMIAKKYTTSNDTKEVVNKIQTTFECCGADGPQNWENSTFSTNNKNQLPDSCCPKETGLCNVKEAKHFKEGCIKKLREGAVERLPVIVGVMIGLAVFQLLILILAIVLCRNTGHASEI